MFLNKVDLVIIEGTDNINNVNLAQKALAISCRNIKYNSINLISPISPSLIYKEIVYHKIDKLTWQEYNKFVIFSLKNYVNSEFCLLIQTDGFVLNSNKWNDVFYNYDYIGSSWLWENNNHFPQEEKNRTPKDEINLVGNGGFTLRSKKFLNESSGLTVYNNEPEDVFVCRTNYKNMKDKGIVYAPVNIANQFAQDPPPNLTDTFGFHGNRGLINDYHI